MESGIGGRNARQRLTTAGDANEMLDVDPLRRQDADRKKPTKSRARRRRRNNKMENKKVPKALGDESLRDLLLFLLRAVHQTQGQVRMLLGIVTDTFILPIASQIVVKMKAEAEAFAAEAQKRRQAREEDDSVSIAPLGPPG